MSLPPGSLAPLFAARTPTNPAFHTSSLGGHYVLLAFLPEPGADRQDALAIIGENIEVFEGEDLILFGVLPDAATFAQAQDRRMIRWVDDTAGEMRRAFGAETNDVL